MADDEVDWGMEESVEVDEWRRGGVNEMELVAEDEDVISLGGDEEEAKPASPRKASTTTNGASHIPTGPSKVVPTGPRKPSSVNRRSLGNVPTGPRSDSHERARPTHSQAPLREREKAKEDEQTSNSMVKTGSQDSAGTTSNKDKDKDKDQAPLPEGWAEVMSKTHNRPFWFHQATNTTSWKRPTESTRPATPPPPPSAIELSVDTKVTDSGSEQLATPALPADSKIVEPTGERKPPTGPSKTSGPPPTTVTLNPETGRRNFVPLGYNPNKKGPVPTSGSDRRRPRSPSPGRDFGAERPSDNKRFKGEGERNSPLPPSGPRNDGGLSDRRPRSPNGRIPQAPRDRRSPPPGGRPSDYPRPSERRPYGEQTRPPPSLGPDYGRGSNGGGPYDTDRREPRGPRDSGYSNPRFGPGPGPRDGLRGDLVSRMAPAPSDFDEHEARRAKLAEEKRLAEEKIRKLAEEEERLVKEAKAKKDREAAEEKAKKDKEEKETREWRAKREEERRKEDEDRAKGLGEFRVRPGRGAPPPREPIRPAPSATNSYDSYRPGGPSPPPVSLADRIGRRPDGPPLRPLSPRRGGSPPSRSLLSDRGDVPGGSSYRPAAGAVSPPRDRFRDSRDSRDRRDQRDRDFRDNRRPDPRDIDRRPGGTFAEPMSAQAQAAPRSRPRSPPPFSRDARDARGPPPPRFEGRPLAERMSRPPPGGENGNGFGRDDRFRDDQRGPPRRH